MYKITIEQKAGDLTTTTTIETSDVDFATYVLEGTGLVDAKITNIEQKKAKRVRDILEDAGRARKLRPFIQPIDENSLEPPFTVTCGGGV